MLDCLGAADHGRVEDLLVIDFACDRVRLLYQAVNRGAFRALRTLAEILEHFLEASHLMLGFTQMIAQAFGELAIGRLLDHGGERFHDLLLGVINVLKRMEEEILHRFDVLGEESHLSSPAGN